MNRKKTVICVFLTIWAVAAVLAAMSTGAFAAEPKLITTESELKEALHNASEGDTILVGDIEFAYSPMGMTLSKGVTIKSGKNTPAVFSGGAFAVMGGASEQDTIHIRFENITFAGVNDIDKTDFTGKQIMTATKIRPAVFFSRCVDAAFVNCDFSGYSMANGGAVYGIYSSADSVGHRLSVSFEDCSLNANAGGYGGAIYLSGAGNIFLDMKNCELSRNVSGYGGAIWADQATVTLESCKISGNRFENFYPDTLTKGGGVYVGRGTLHMKNCYVLDNQARNGGGIALSYTESVLDGCVISGNRATENGGGIWNENYGNNLVTVVNGTIANNTSASGGALYISENQAEIGSGGVGKTFLVLSTLSGNTPAMKEYDAERLSLFGCALHGEGRTEAMPSEANQYCYMTETNHLGDPYKHMEGSVEIDGDALEGVSGNRFDNRYGVFHAGNNARSDMTYRFLVDGEVKDTVTVCYGEIPTLPEYQKDGYTFDRWQFGDGGDYAPDTRLSVGGGTEYVDLYAVWTPNTYKITFVMGETETRVSCDFGAPILFPESEAKEGYTFSGWFATADGEGEPIAEGTVHSTAGDVTYYACYRLNETEVPPVTAPPEPPVTEPVTTPDTEPVTTPDTESVILPDTEVTSTPATEPVTPSTAPPGEEPPRFPLLPIVLLSVAVSVLGVVCVLLLFRRNRKEREPIPAVSDAVPAEGTATVPPPIIVRMRYTDEEIDRILRDTEEVNLLTDRELDVLRELLKGRKQSEIAYYLGITVNTVKEYTRKVYGKLGVGSKNELFERIDGRHRKDP